MLLKNCPFYKLARLVSFECDPAYKLRMQELGLREGCELLVTQKAAFGGRVINIRGSRVAVDAASTKRIHVILMEEEA